MENKRGNRFTDRTGEEYKTNEGHLIKIIEYFGAINVTIKFEDDTILKNVFFSALKSGQVSKPKNRVWEIYISNEGQKAKIVVYNSSLNISIKFEDGNIIDNLQYDNVKKGAFKNPYLKNICNIGYLGNVEGLNKDSKYSLLYSKWTNMIKRCYDEKELLKYPTYKSITICEEWFCFKNFFIWANDKYNSEYMKNWQLDKDILFKGNRIYSPETCCFVPSTINNLFIKSDTIRGKYPIGVHAEGNKFKTTIKIRGKQKTLKRCSTPEEAFEVYKKVKEQYIKDTADEYKDLIDPQVYQAMCSYQVEITD